MARQAQDALRIEALRVRAAIERAEVRAAVLELGDATQPLRRVFGVASGIARTIRETRSSGIGPLAVMLLGVLREQPWLLSSLVTITTRRGRRYWLVLAGVAALAAWFTRSVAQRTKPGAPRPR